MPFGEDLEGKEADPAECSGGGEKPLREAKNGFYTQDLPADGKKDREIKNRA